MAKLRLAAPILPGKEEAWRRFAQELSGSRRAEYEQSLARLGITRERAWMKQTPQGAIAIVCVEADEPERAVSHFAVSPAPFDRWLREQLLALHGLGSARIEADRDCELLFDSLSTTMRTYLVQEVSNE